MMVYKTFIDTYCNQTLSDERSNLFKTLLPCTAIFGKKLDSPHTTHYFLPCHFDDVFPLVFSLEPYHDLLWVVLTR